MMHKMKSARSTIDLMLSYAEADSAKAILEIHRSDRIKLARRVAMKIKTDRRGELVLMPTVY